MQALVFWNEFVGTVVYAAQFTYHKLPGKIGWKNTVLFVVLTNGLWAVLPVIGIATMKVVVEENSFAMFR